MTIKNFIKIYPEHVGLISYNYTAEYNGIESYKINYKNIYAELIIYMDDVLQGLQMDSVEFNVNGEFIKVPKLAKLNLDNMLDVYIYMTEYIDLHYPLQL